MSSADPNLGYMQPDEDMVNHFGIPNSAWLKMLRPELAGYSIPHRFKYQMGNLHNQGNMYRDLMRSNREFYDQNSGTLVQQNPHYLEAPILSRENSFLGKRKVSVGSVNKLRDIQITNESYYISGCLKQTANSPYTLIQVHW